MRELSTPHGTFGIAVDEQNQELFLTVEHDNAVVVYRKMAQGEETPLRLLQGDQTQLADPHGIVVDTRNGLMFVANHGSTHQVRGENEKPNWPLDRDRMVRGSGRLLPPSITVYPIKAQGDAAPLRVIQGSLTQLNWPSNMSIDEERGEIYVANDPDHSILVFKATDQGNVAPTRVIKGPKTGLKNPTGVFVDLKNNELWVSNMGNHSATVYPRTANGDAAPLRTIRSAPLGKQALMIGNPGAIDYDTKRDEILVPN
jgi:DNA-binding beta-propeller fold protein YncE